MKGLGRTLVVSLLVLLGTSAADVRAQQPQYTMQQVVSSFNDWLVASRSPLDASHRTDDQQRLKQLLDSASTAPWLQACPGEYEKLMGKLRQIAAYLYQDFSKPYPPELQTALQDLANEVGVIRSQLVQLNGGREVLDQRNLPSGAQPAGTTTPAPGTGTAGNPPGSTVPGATAPGTQGTGPGSLLGVTPGAGPNPAGTPVTPGAITAPPGNPGGPGTQTMSTPQSQLQDLIARCRAAGLNIVSMKTDPNNPNNVIITLSVNGAPGSTPASPGTGPGTSTGPSTTTTGSAGPTATTTGSVAGGTPNGTASTSGTVGRGGAKQAVGNAQSALQSLLADGNLNNGAIVGPDGNTTQAAKDSLSDIASLLRPISGTYGADVNAIIGQMQQLANASYGPGAGSNPQAFQQANQQVRAVRDQIFAKLTALNSKIDSGS